MQNHLPLRILNHCFYFDCDLFFLVTENEREFDYGAKSEKGPKNWGTMKKEWGACNNGTLQSPIDMSNERVKIISKPENRIYKVGNATVKNRGHDIQVSLFNYYTIY